MNRCQTSIMTRVHSGKHIKCFAAATLTYHDPVGTHSESVSHQITNGDRTFTFHVSWPSFKSEHVLLFELKFCGVFNSNDAFSSRNKTGENVEESCFTGTRFTTKELLAAYSSTCFEFLDRILGPYKKTMA